MKTSFDESMIRAVCHELLPPVRLPEVSTPSHRPRLAGWLDDDLIDGPQPPIPTGPWGSDLGYVPPSRGPLYPPTPTTWGDDGGWVPPVPERESAWRVVS